MRLPTEMSIYPGEKSNYTKILLTILPTMIFVILLSGFAFSQGILDDKWHTYQEVLDTLTDLRDSHPEILYLDTLGFSTRDSIPMLRLKISDNPSIDEDEPVIFLDGGVHADELLSVEVIVNFVQDIVSKYDQGNPTIIGYIQAMEIFAIPFVNPEGHLVVESGDLDWRKNKSDNDTNSVFDYHDGVDNNRNYDFGWSIDGSTNSNVPESLMFKGYYPFSESENRAMRDFGWQYRPVIAMDYHTPTYGRPNCAYYPWYWYPSQGGHGYCPDEDLLHTICEEFTSLILPIPDTTSDPGGMYDARRGLVNKGDFKTYFYGNFGTAAFTVEISDTTIQDTSLVDSIVAAHLPGQYYLLERALGPGITGIIRDSISLEPLEAEVQVLEHINEDINPRLSRPDFGRYHRLLLPGTYTLRFIKDGYYTKTISGVAVGSSVPAVTDVLLQPENPTPPTPVLIYPINDTVNAAFITFDWENSVGATGYVFELADNVSFNPLLEYDSTAAQSEYTNTSSLEEGVYYWRAAAYNGNGYSAPSPAASFTVEFILPTPELYEPEDDDTLSSPYINFDWQDVPAGTTIYIFELAEDVQFNNMVEYDSLVPPSEYANVAPLENGEYFWRVTAFDGYRYSDPSSPFHFTIDLLLPTPVLETPEDGDTLSTQFIDFDWQDVPAGTTIYIFELAEDVQFNNMVEYDSLVPPSEYTNVAPLENGSYFWRVTAVDGINYSDPSEPFQFTVDTLTVFYMPGDANGDEAIIGSDVTFLVNYFRGGSAPPIEVNGFYPGADVNGDCLNLGSDVIYLVNYFRGGNPPTDGECF